MELPIDFVKQMEALLSLSEVNALFRSMGEDAWVSVRKNPFKSKDLNIVEGEQVPWTTDGFYLQNRPSFTFDPLFHSGCYYVQEASSMILEQAVKQYIDQPVVALDLCAAPGGKSTLLRSWLPEGSLLVSNEIMTGRAQVLAENMSKWGHPDVVVTNNDSADFSSLDSLFDIILTDVPCSGEGMFRKDEVAVSEWSLQNVEVCWRRQREILENIWPCLKPGGLLIYSTCTYNTKENEENVEWIASELGAEVLPLKVDPSWDIVGNLLSANFPVYRFMPHHTRGEGLFMAVLRKHDDGGSQHALKISSKKDKQKVLFPKEAIRQSQQWVNASDNYEWLTGTDSANIVPTQYKLLIEDLKRRLKVLKSGVTVARLKGKDLIPEHDLLMSNLFNHEEFPHAELTYQQAIAYLRKEALMLTPDVPRGYVCVTYQQVPLGWVKNLGNRANNLYPQEWRIRSGYVPSECPSILTKEG